jgi:hypothetical protein
VRRSDEESEVTPQMRHPCCDATKMPRIRDAREPEKRSVLPVREHFQATEQRRRWGFLVEMPLKMPQMQGASLQRSEAYSEYVEATRKATQRRRWGIFSGISGCETEAPQGLFVSGPVFEYLDLDIQAHLACPHVFELMPGKS